VLERGSMSDSFGFGLAENDRGNMIIASTKAEPALSKLRPLDEVIAVNGQPTEGMQHGDVVGMVVGGLQVQFDILRVQTATPVSRALSISQASPNTVVAERADDIGHTAANLDPTYGNVAEGKERLTVVLERGSMSDSFGFGLAENDRGNMIIASTKAEPALSKLRPLDEVIAVNGQPTEGMQHGDVVGMVVGALQVQFDILRVQTATPVSQRLTISQASPNTVVTERADDIGQRHAVSVVLERFTVQESFGFSLGEAEQGHKMIAEVRPDTVSYGKLVATDIIQFVDGMSATDMPHEALVGVITSALVIHMDVLRAGNAVQQELQTTQTGTEAVPNNTKVIELERGATSQTWGFAVKQTTQETFEVSHVGAGGLSEGYLKMDDVMLRINGTDLAGLTHEGVVSILKSSLKLQITVQRVGAGLSAASASTVQRMSIPPLIRQQGESFGFNLGQTASEDVVIASVTEDGLSEGYVTEGDVLRVVNGKNVAGMKYESVIQIISSSQEIRLEVDRDFAQSLSSHWGVEDDDHGEGQVEQMIVMLVRSDTGGLGMGLSAGDGITTVASVQPGGSAQSSGLMQHDRIVEVDGQTVVGLDHSAVVELIEARQEVELTIQRDF